MQINQVILGDNQFFGVNHMSQDKGKETYEQFKDMDEIKRIMYYSLNKGVNGVMFSTHPSINSVCEMIRQDETLRKNFQIYVNVPYIIKYVSMVTEMGIYQTMKAVIKSQEGKKKIPFLLKSAVNAVTLNYIGIFERMLDVELAPFRGLNVKAVFLHNALCDLILAYKLDNIVKGFDRYISEKYKAIPGYGTLNFMQFSQYLESIDMKGKLIMTAFNKNGFLMNPGREACEQELKTTSHTVLAMATLASGALKPQEAYEYLQEAGIKNVTVGLSSPKHADETFNVIKSKLLEAKDEATVRG